jgi:hypothetical protein
MKYEVCQVLKHNSATYGSNTNSWKQQFNKQRYLPKKQQQNTMVYRVMKMARTSFRSNMYSSASVLLLLSPAKWSKLELFRLADCMMLFTNSQKFPQNF